MHRLAVLLPLLLASCQPLVVREPLTPIESSTPDPDLVGTWRVEFREPEASYAFVEIDRTPLHGRTVMRISAVNHDNRNFITPTQTFHVSESGGLTYANFHFTEPAGAREPPIAAYAVMRYAIEGDTLQLWPVPTYEAIQEGIRRGELTGTVEEPTVRPDGIGEAKETRYKLDTDGEELLDWLVRNDPRVFPVESAVSYQRVGSPNWPSRPVEWGRLALATLGGIAIGVALTRVRFGSRPSANGDSSVGAS